MTNISQFTRQHFLHLWGDLKSWKTAKANIDACIDGLGPLIKLEHIQPRNIDAMVVRWRKSGVVAPATINRRLSCLSKLLGHAHRIGEINSIPSIKYLSEPKGRDYVFTDEILERMKNYSYTFEHVDGVWVSAFMDVVYFLLDTGCRSGELWKLELRDVFSRDNTRFVRFRAEHNKTNIERIIPLTDRAYGAAMRLKAGDIGYTKEQFRSDWQNVRTRLLEQDNPVFVPHSLRHTCATRLVTAGVPLVNVMKWMGHSNITTTMRYSHLNTSDLMGALDVMEGK